MNVLRDTIQVAKKFYLCDACQCWLRSNYGQQDVTADDWLIVEGAQADKWKIRAGQEYRKVVYEDGGLWTYRARLDMDALCQRYELFDE